MLTSPALLALAIGLAGCASEPIGKTQVELNGKVALELGPVIVMNDEGAAAWMPDGSPLSADHPIWQSVKEGKSDESGV